MRHADYSDFTWKKNKLYLGDTYWGQIVPCEGKLGMWKILWEGTAEFSTDCWNKDRARDNFVKMAQFLNNQVLAPYLDTRDSP